MPFQLITERLRITEFTSDDALFIKKLVNSEGWLKYIGDRNVLDETGAIIYIEKLRKNYEEQGFGFWKVELLENSSAIGMCGIIHRDGLEHADIGFAMLPEFEGKGYARESSLAVKDYALNQLKMKELLAITELNNNRSINLLNRIGLIYDKNIMLNKEELMLFKLNRE